MSDEGIGRSADRRIDGSIRQSTNPPIRQSVLQVEDLGRRPYGEVLELQRAIAAERIAGTRPDTLLLVEHDPVVTLGRSTKQGNLLANPQLLAARGVEVFDIERGGDVTFHGPGQLVGYPIIDLTQHRQDLHWYLRQLEQVLIDAIGTFGVVGGREEKYTGVWVGDRKIASIGVHARSWVTWHGFALNVSTDLSYFDLMVPCGIQGVSMTSLERELARPVSLATVASQVVVALGQRFDLEPSSLARA
jgi:lipoate-protein ligase B